MLASILRGEMSQLKEDIQAAS
jgi:hypothetical protein